VRRPRRFLLAICALALASVALSSCSAGYVLRSAWYQAEMLGSRVPIEQVRRTGGLTPKQLAALDVIEDVKAFGHDIGLRSTKNYGTVAMGFQRRIFNVSACAPLAFTSKTWWFPIVGRVPYLGYFTETDARASAGKLTAEGYDVYLGQTGAYSTLGWFKDPILPSMLDWDEFDLADTILHELTHATVWVPGGVPFNESFASFVGEEGAFRYLAARHGADSAQFRKAREGLEDDARWHEVLHGLYVDLKAVYSQVGLDEAGKRERKAALLASLPARVAASTFHDPAPYARAGAGDWNNARLAMFRTYNSDRPAFARLLAREDGDLIRFIERVRQIASHGEPFAALRAAASAGEAANAPSAPTIAAGGRNAGTPER
jgi:predicted aminopeptidase